MADAETPPTETPEDDAGDRGTLEVRTRAIQHIVEQVVLETPGTVAHRTTLGRLRGAYTPKADITMLGGSARIAVDVACVWPCRVGDIAVGVRNRVLTETARLSGVHVIGVDVTISTLSEAELDQAEKRRVE